MSHESLCDRPLCDCRFLLCLECGEESHDTELVNLICRECRCTWECEDCGLREEPDVFEGTVCDGCAEQRREAERDEAMAVLA